MCQSKSASVSRPSREQRTCTKSSFFHKYSLMALLCPSEEAVRNFRVLHMNKLQHKNTVWGRDFTLAKNREGDSEWEQCSNKKDQLEPSETRQGEKCSPAASDGLEVMHITQTQTYSTALTLHNSQSVLKTDYWWKITENQYIGIKLGS